MDTYTRKQKSLSLRSFLLVASAIAAAFILVYHDNAFFPSALGAEIYIKKAIVVVSGNSSVSGSITLHQSSPNRPVKISGKIQGLSPNALRGFHVHQSGDLSGGCLSAGPHFNPYGKTHGAPTDRVRHVGDLGNIQSDQSGVAEFSISDKLITLYGPNSVVGRSVVVHAGTDDLGRGNNEESLKTGNAGARAACGVIGLV